MNDLAPHLARKGFLPIYIDLWSSRGCVLDGVLEKLAMAEFALRNGENPINKMLGASVSAIEAFGIKLDLSGDAEPPMPENKFLWMNRMLQRLHRITKMPVVLLVDEIQAVITDPKAMEFCSAFRAALNENQGHVSAVFTGSSQTALNALFAKTGAPLYEFSSHMDFPSLGPSFVDFLNTRYAEMNDGRKLHRDALIFAFKELDCMPRPMIDLVLLLHRTKDTDVLRALSRVAERKNVGSDWTGQWNGFRPIERAVLSRLAADENILDRGALEAYKEALGVPVAEAAVQQVVNRMSRDGLLTAEGQRRYTFSSPEFKRWTADYIAGRTTCAPVSLASISRQSGMDSAITLPSAVPAAHSAAAILRPN